MLKLLIESVLLLNTQQHMDIGFGLCVSTCIHVYTYLLRIRKLFGRFGEVGNVGYADAPFESRCPKVNCNNKAANLCIL
jgi:hypothetical protein